MCYERTDEKIYFVFWIIIDMMYTVFLTSSDLMLYFVYVILWYVYLLQFYDFMYTYLWILVVVSGSNPKVTMDGRLQLQT